MSVAGLRASAWSIPSNGVCWAESGGGGEGGSGTSVGRFDLGGVRGWFCFWAYDREGELKILLNILTGDYISQDRRK